MTDKTIDELSADLTKAQAAHEAAQRNVTEATLLLQLATKRLNSAQKAFAISYKSLRDSADKDSDWGRERYVDSESNSE